MPSYDKGTGPARAFGIHYSPIPCLSAAHWLRWMLRPLRQAVGLAKAAAGACLLLAAFAATASGQSTVSLAWDPCLGEDIAGYNVYYGAASQTYTNTLSTTTAIATITGLTPGTTYYFTATAYNSLGLEGARSPEISYTVPVLPPARPTLHVNLAANNQVVLGGTGQAGSRYNVLASTDLVSWALVTTLTAAADGSLTYTATPASTNPFCAYRLQAAP